MWSKESSRSWFTHYISLYIGDIVRGPSRLQTNLLDCLLDFMMFEWRFACYGSRQSLIIILYVSEVSCGLSPEDAIDIVTEWAAVRLRYIFPHLGVQEYKHYIAELYPQLSRKYGDELAAIIELQQAIPHGQR